MEREQLEVDVLFVGAGPASLAAALHLSRLVRDHNQSVERGSSGRKLQDLTLLVIEKGKDIGAHALSGAVVDPRGFRELLQGFPGEEPPYDAAVHDDALYWMTRNEAIRSPLTPLPLRNHGYFVASLGKLVRWMAQLCEKNGIEVYPEFPAVELLYEEKVVKGVRIGDKGRDKNAAPKSNFEPGIDVLSRVTVLGEGPRGTLAKQASRKLNLEGGRPPQIYSIGVKEIWQSSKPVRPGIVYHTLGYPLAKGEFGGAFIYTMQENLIDVGCVVGLDSPNPRTDCHLLLQKLKTHPFVRSMLEGGKLLSYGAKAVPEGGYYAMPQLYSDGLLIVGDSAGFLNAQRLKGIHLAIKSGMLAAETIFDALLKNDFSAQTLQGYSQRFEKSWAREELWKVRNFRQAFQRGFWSGMFHGAVQLVTHGRGLKDPFPIAAGHACMEPLQKWSADHSETINFDGQYTFDKLTDVYYSNTAHEEDQPCHLKILDFDICHHRCTFEYGNPCQYFCPANVYEMVGEEGKKRLQLNFTNCVHCKTCDIMDPYQIIIWTPPEGGGGPDYKNM